MELRLSAQRAAVARARHWVAERAREEQVDEPMIPVVELLTSELVANALLHGPSGAEVTVRAHRVDAHFTVAVLDASDDPPVLRQTPPEVPGGQGMRLVDRLASTWGVEVSPPGKAVWFRVPL